MADAYIPYLIATKVYLPKLFEIFKKELTGKKIYFNTNSLFGLDVADSKKINKDKVYLIKTISNIRHNKDHMIIDIDLEESKDQKDFVICKLIHQKPNVFHPCNCLVLDSKYGFTFDGTNFAIRYVNGDYDYIIKLEDFIKKFIDPDIQRKLDKIKILHHDMMQKCKDAISKAAMEAISNVDVTKTEEEIEEELKNIKFEVITKRKDENV